MHCHSLHPTSRRPFTSIQCRSVLGVYPPQCTSHHTSASLQDSAYHTKPRRLSTSSHATAAHSTSSLAVYTLQNISPHLSASEHGRPAQYAPILGGRPKSMFRMRVEIHRGGSFFVRASSKGHFLFAFRWNHHRNSLLLLSSVSAGAIAKV